MYNREAILKYRRSHPEKSKDRITITLNQLDKEILDKASRWEGCTRSELVRRLVWKKFWEIEEAEERNIRRED